jgi:hypothetical protein
MDKKSGYRKKDMLVHRGGLLEIMGIGRDRGPE